MLSFHQFENEINVNVCNLNVNDQPIGPFQVKIEQDIHVNLMRTDMKIPPFSRRFLLRLD